MKSDSKKPNHGWTQIYTDGNVEESSVLIRVHLW